MLDKTSVKKAALTVCLLALGASGLPSRAAEAVKLLLPAQYADRIVAPRKGRVLLVNFWATWCEPCREEMPDLAAAAKAFPAKDLAVVLVSIDSQKTGLTSVPKFLAQLKSPFVCWLAKYHDPEEFIPKVDSSWDGTVPYTIVYDRKGRPAQKLMGKQTAESFSAAIKKAL